MGRHPTIYRARLAAQFVLCAMFFVAAIGKAGSVHEFSAVVIRAAQPMFSITGSNALWIACGLVLWEGVLASMLLTIDPKWRHRALLSAFATLSVFTIVLLVAIRNGSSIKCGCAGSVPTFGLLSVEPRVAVARNCFLMWVVIWVYLGVRANTQKLGESSAIPVAESA